MEICSYGCCQSATYQLKNGNWCCSKSPNSCPAMKSKNSQGLKGRVRSEEHSNKISQSKKGKPTWNKGLTKEVDKRLEQQGKTYAERVKNGKIIPSFAGKHHSKEVKQKISANGKGKIGGYRKGSGRGKKGWYKGYWCDSTWELAFVIYNLDHNIKFERNSEAFEYQYQDTEYRYYPDFIMEDGTYIEIKGYETEQTLEKYKAINKPLKVLKEKDLQYVFDYVVLTYGKNYVELYE